MRDQEFNYTPQGEFNAPSQEEFHPSKEEFRPPKEEFQPPKEEFCPAQENGDAVGKAQPKKRDRARRSALMQAAAVVVTVAVAAGAASYSQNDVISLTPEQKEYLDALYAACLSEDDEELYRLVQQPVDMESETCFYDGKQAFLSCKSREDLMRYSYLWGHAESDDPVQIIHIDRDTGAGLFSFLINRSEMRESAEAYFRTVDEADEKGSTVRCHGYYKRKQTSLDGYRYETEMSGEFVRASAGPENPEDQNFLFLENGTLLTNWWTSAFEGSVSQPLQFEVKAGYLLADGILTAETYADNVWLRYAPSGIGLGAIYPDDPFYHTHAQMAYIP